MIPAAAEPPAEDSGSFRDRSGRVYHAGGEVFRGLDAAALANFRSLATTEFFRAFAARGEIIGTEECSGPPVLPSDTTWAGWLRHQRVPFVTYPYEWTFGMLRAAAMLQLRLLEAALGEGWTMKDASPYNVQFIAGRPVFIDVPSFEPAGDAPWPGYRQFCQMYLFPLMLQAYRQVDFQPWLRARLDGIDVQQMARLFGWRDGLRRGVITHVWLQALFERRHGGSERDIRRELGQAGFRRELVLANVRRLARLLEELAWKAAGSAWADYANQHNYSAADLAAKQRFVERAVQSSAAREVWDIGCNTGSFSGAAARHCELVLAMDADHLAVERLYQNAEIMGSGRVLPLLQDITDPSPAWGWNLAERIPLAARGRPDLVLCLALVHHVVIGGNVPVQHFVDWLASLGADLVIEFVGRDDDRVRTLLRNRVDQYADYCPEEFEACLNRHFSIAQTCSLSGGRRTLYHCRRRKP